MTKQDVFRPDRNLPAYQQMVESIQSFRQSDPDNWTIDNAKIIFGAIEDLIPQSEDSIDTLSALLVCHVVDQTEETLALSQEIFRDKTDEITRELIESLGSTPGVNFLIEVIDIAVKGEDTANKRVTEILDDESQREDYSVWELNAILRLFNNR